MFERENKTSLPGLTASLRFFLAIVIATGLSGSLSASDQFTQEIVLNPGWNAVFLSVQPQPADPATVFSGLPVNSVWTWAERRAAVEFIVDPSELTWNRSGWLGYRAKPSEALLTNLFSIVANRAYLVKIEGEVPVTWSVTGRPSTLPIEWIPDSFNLVGFHADPAVPSSFGEFLEASPAHVNQAIFALDSGSGQWQMVEDAYAETVNFGQAYWVYCEGASNYQGPWSIDIVAMDGIDLGRTLNSRDLRLLNHTQTARQIQIREMGSGDSLGLTFKRFDADRIAYEWLPLASMSHVSLPAGGRAPLSLAIDRAQMTAPAVGSLLELRDGLGTRRLLPMRALR